MDDWYVDKFTIYVRLTLSCICIFYFESYNNLHIIKNADVLVNKVFVDWTLRKLIVGLLWTSEQTLASTSETISHCLNSGFSSICLNPGVSIFQSESLRPNTHILFPEEHHRHHTSLYRSLRNSAEGRESRASSSKEINEDTDGEEWRPSPHPDTAPGSWDRTVFYV